MAILVTKTVVCDECRTATDGLVTVQVSVDGKRAKQILCPRHTAPYAKLLEKMGGGKPTGRGRVYTPEEIAARKRPAAKKR